MNLLLKQQVKKKRKKKYASIYDKCKVTHDQSHILIDTFYKQKES